MPYATPSWSIAINRPSTGLVAEHLALAARLHVVHCDFVTANDEIYEGVLSGEQIGERLDRAIADVHPGLSRERIKTLISEGRIIVDGSTVRQASQKLVEAGTFSIHMPPPTPLDVKPEDIPLTVVDEDDALIVIDKPSGMVVHPAAGHESGTLVNALLHHCKGQLSGIGGVARPGIVHRIDKDTSGLLVVAKTDAAHQALARQFADHSIERRYMAVVNGYPVPTTGKVEGNIGRSSQDRKKMAIVPASRGKHAITHYVVEQHLKDSAIVECRLETGRTHQVRVHMASTGHALLGDPVYGGAQKNHRKLLRSINFCRQALHAKTLGFVHPLNREKKMYFSEIPADLVELISRLSVL